MEFGIKICYMTPVEWEKAKEDLHLETQQMKSRQRM